MAIALKNLCSNRIATGGALLLLVARMTSLQAGIEKAYIPASDSEVLERRRPMTASELEWRRQFISSHAVALDLPAAVEMARQFIELSRSEGDPRYLGHAETVLNRWWESKEAPADILLLRATIEQGRHEFTKALESLDKALRLEPRSAGAWLTRATIHTVRGEYAEARIDCLNLSRLADPLTVMAATAAVASMTGSAEASLKSLELTLQREGGRASQRTLIWAHTVAAEIADRLGRTESADTHFSEVFRVAPRERYALAVWADAQMASGNAALVVRKLRDFTQSDALLLRFAEAAVLPDSGADEKTAAGAVTELGERIDRAHARGSQLHLREEARYRLHLANNPTAALQLAQANWEVQREPVDWRLLMEASRAAGAKEVEMEAQAWATEHRYEDARYR